MKIDTGILPDGRQGKHMNEVEEILEQLIHKIATTKEYNQYMTMLDRIKSQPDLYHRIGEFRRRVWQSRCQKVTIKFRKTTIYRMNTVIC